MKHTDNPSSRNPGIAFHVIADVCALKDTQIMLKRDSRCELIVFMLVLSVVIDLLETA